MSRENVETLRQANEAVARRDRATCLALVDEDVELEPDRNWPEPGVRGAEVVWDDYLRIMDAFERFPVDDADIIDAGADKVVSHYRFRISGKGSGAGVEFDYWGVFTIRQGKFGRGQYFVDRAEALAAAGLQE